MKVDYWCTVTETVRYECVIGPGEALRERGGRESAKLYVGAKKTSPAITKATKPNNRNCH
jgi:hypothetical protein